MLCLIFTCEHIQWQVLEIFKNIVFLAFYPRNPSKSELLATKGGDEAEQDLSGVLRELRRQSAIARGQRKDNSNEDCKKYLEYVKRELTICEHIKDVLSMIKADTRGTSGQVGSSTVYATFTQNRNLEAELEEKHSSTRAWTEHICKLIGLVVGVRDWVPRSQLSYTLELVLVNAELVLVNAGLVTHDRAPVNAGQRNGDGAHEENRGEPSCHNSASRGAS